MTTSTADLDRLIGFYERVFGAPVVLDLEEEGVRHAFLELGLTTVLHPFEVPGVHVRQGRIPMFQRGRLDHVALNAPIEDAFRVLYRRVAEEDAAASRVSDIGGASLFTFIDPDGARHEVVGRIRAARGGLSSARSVDDGAARIQEVSSGGAGAASAGPSR